MPIKVKETDYQLGHVPAMISTGDNEHSLSPAAFDAAVALALYELSSPQPITKVVARTRHITSTWSIEAGALTDKVAVRAAIGGVVLRALGVRILNSATVQWNPEDIAAFLDG